MGFSEKSSPSVESTRLSRPMLFSEIRSSKHLVEVLGRTGDYSDKREGSYQDSSTKLVHLHAEQLSQERDR